MNQQAKHDEAAQKLEADLLAHYKKNIGGLMSRDDVDQKPAADFVARHGSVRMGCIPNAGQTFAPETSPKEPTILTRLGQLVDHLAELASLQSEMRYRLLGEAEQGLDQAEIVPQGVTALLARAAQMAANLVGEHKTMLVRL